MRATRTKTLISTASIASRATSSADAVWPTSRSATSCSLCDELRGTTRPLYNELAGTNFESRILDENEDWVVVPSLGPLAAGHVMVLPRDHLFASLDANRRSLALFQSLVATVSDRLRQLYPDPVLIFEHGSTQADASCGACIDHAHLHIVPGPASFIESTRALFSNWEDFRSWTHLGEGRYRVRPPYHLIGVIGPKPELYIRRSSGNVPSQFLRQILARAMGRPDAWNWRRDPGPALFSRTISDWFAS